MNYRIRHKRIYYQDVNNKHREHLLDNFEARISDFNLMTRKQAEDAKIDTSQVHPTGGITEFDVLDEEGNVILTTSSSCSLRDNFSRRLGLEIASGRARKTLLSKGIKVEF